MYLKILFLILFFLLLRRVVKSYTRKHYKPKYRPINTDDTMDYSNVQKISDTVGGKYYQFSSKAEYLYALHLEKEKKAGKIADWSYEETMFAFFCKPSRGWNPEGVKQVIYPPTHLNAPEGNKVRAYIPDFRILHNDRTEEYVEIKGRWTQRAKTAVENMKIYHRKVKLTVVYPKYR